MDILNDNIQENWSNERVKHLTMSKITAKNSPKKVKRPSHLLVTIATCAILLITMGITAYAFDAFGIRSFFNYYWIAQDDGTIELNVDDIRFRFGGGYYDRLDGTGTEFKSITLSPTTLDFSYVYDNRFEHSEAWGFFIIMNDHAIIPVDITYYHVDRGLFTGSGNLSEVVNLDEVADVGIWRCYGALGFSSSSIAVHSGEFDYEINRARHAAMWEFFGNLER